MSAASFFQSLAGESLDFFEFVAEALGNDIARRDLIRDLGGDPAAVVPVSPFPANRLDSIRAYRDSADPNAEAALGMLQDIGVLIGAIGANYAAWRANWRIAAQDSVHSAFDLLATNYVRLRYPRIFLVLQAFSFLEDVTTLDAPGSNSLVRLGQAFRAAALFLWHPGRMIEEIDPEGTGTRIFDVSVRLLSTFVVVAESLNKLDVPLITELLYGWDGPGLDVDSPQRPRGADLISARMATLVMGHVTGDSSSDLQGIEKLKLTLAAVPRGHGGPGVFLALGGKFERLVPLDDNWQLSVKFEGDSTISGVIGKTTRFFDPDRHSALRVGVVSRPAADGGPSFAWPQRGGSRVEIGRFSAGTNLASNRLEFELRISNGALVLEGKDNDGFIGALLGDVPLRLPFSIALGVSTEGGLFFKGEVPALSSLPSAAPEIRARAAAGSSPELPELPPLSNPGAPGSPAIEGVLPLARSIGPLTINEIVLRLTRAPTDKALRDTTRFSIEALTTFSVRIGPVFARVVKLGVALTIDSGKPPDKANLGVVDIDLGLSGPQGIALAIDAPPVSGGGLLYHDPAQHLYAGAMSLTLGSGLTFKAFGLVATRMPDGSKGYSLIVFITAEDFRPIPIGMACTLQGIGGMIAIHRTFNETAMREGLRNNTLGKLLFPKDPIRNAPDIIRNLGTVFPARQGSYLLGVLVKIGWFSPTLVTLDLALILEFGSRKRLIALGRIQSLLPSRDNALIKLNLDALGVIDFDEGKAEIDAVLVDSRLAQKFVLTGDMALRARWKSGPGAGFAMSIGGFNPRFVPPAGMPKLARIAVALSSGDNPRLTCEAYFAITVNTIQFGARAQLYAAAIGFSVQGDVGFDVLIQLVPFHFLAEFHASLQLKRGSRSLFKVKVAAALEGPRPLRISGKASFEILWCDFTVRFDKTLISGQRPPLPPAVNVLEELRRALSDAQSWSTQRDAQPLHGVALRKLAPCNTLVLDPLGTLSVKQQVVPLNTTRDIDTFGGAPVAGIRRFDVKATLSGQSTQPVGVVKDLFAPAQFFNMSDDEKLASPSFEEMQAGVTFGTDAVAFDEGRSVASPLTFETIVIDAAGQSTKPKTAMYALSPQRLSEQVRVSAVARAAVRSSSFERFSDAQAPQAAGIQPVRWVVTALGDTGMLAPGISDQATWSEKRASLAALNRTGNQWQLVPEHEF